METPAPGASPGSTVKVPSHFKSLKLGSEFNKEVTKDTLKKKLPMWTRYTNENIQHLLDLSHKCGTEKGWKQVRVRGVLRDIEVNVPKRPLLSYSVEELRPDFVLKPCLIVGYGNSFHETVDMLKELPRDKINVIATDRPYRKLVENGVIPDMVVNLDAGPQIRPFYDVALSENEKSKVAHALAICTDPMENKWVHGRKFWYIPAVTGWNNTLTKDTRARTGFPVVPTAGNVGTCSMMLAKILGARPLVLIGMDFGRELLEGKDNKATDDRLSCSPGDVRLRTASGREFISDPVLHAYAYSTRSLLLLYNIPVMNCSGGILHGKWMQTVKPLPQEGGKARDRMDTFIKAIKTWPMTQEIQETRAAFKAGTLKLPTSMFLPQLRDPATVEDEILRTQVQEMRDMALAPADGRSILDEKGPEVA